MDKERKGGEGGAPAPREAQSTINNNKTSK